MSVVNKDSESTGELYERTETLLQVRVIGRPERVFQLRAQILRQV
jgi:hypothetical protein